MKKLFLIIGLTLLLTISNKVYALEVNQTISDNETIEEINSIDIKVKGTDTKLSNFLTTKWRTYVKLDELCSNDLGVCKIKSSTNEKIILTRNYENLDDIYYETEYTYKDNKYKSKLIAPNSSSFDFGETDVSPDVKPVKIEKDIYVPIRFITEALGAEVIYENKSGEEKAKVKIDFYSNMNLDFNVKFYDINTIKNDDYSTMKKYDFKDLTKNNCYDVVVKTNDKNIFNTKLFSANSDFVKIDYNNNVQTNICLKSEVKNKSLDFVINYKNIPVIYTVNQLTGANNTPEVTKNPYYIYLGDSRFVGMQYAISLKSNEKIIAKSSQGYNWFINTAEATVDSIIKDTTYKYKIAFNLGVNDLQNVSKYKQKLTELASSKWKEIDIYYVSINPIDDAKAKNNGYGVFNNSVVKFNNDIKNIENNIKYCDVYSKIINNFSTTDGIHYTNTTNLSIYNEIQNCMN